MAAIWQNAPAIALENGCYDGLSAVAELKRHGDLGIGAFDQLDGEMVGVDGTFYQVTADAVAKVPADDATLPFCMVTAFGASDRTKIPEDMHKDRLFDWIDELVHTGNVFFSLRLDGSFDNVRTRCLPRQKKPFPPMSEVVKTQPTFEYDRVEGTMVGFRAPSYIGRTSPPSYHLHFVSASRSYGGHVISFDGCDASIAFEQIERQEILYPTTREFAEKDLG